MVFDNEKKIKMENIEENKHISLTAGIDDTENIEANAARIK